MALGRPWSGCSGVQRLLGAHVLPAEPAILTWPRDHLSPNLSAPQPSYSEQDFHPSAAGSSALTETTAAKSSAGTSQSLVGGAPVEQVRLCGCTARCLSPQPHGS